jgi:hypothetical protein
MPTVDALEQESRGDVRSKPGIWRATFIRAPHPWQTSRSVLAGVTRVSVIGFPRDGTQRQPWRGAPCPRGQYALRSPRQPHVRFALRDSLSLDAPLLCGTSGGQAPPLWARYGETCHLPSQRTFQTRQCGRSQAGALQYENTRQCRCLSNHRHQYSLADRRLLFRNADFRFSATKGTPIQSVMWRLLQHCNPDDYLLATGETPVREFIPFWPAA